MASNILSSMLIFIQGKADTSGFTKTDSAIRKTAQNVRSARKEMSLFSKMNKELTRGLSRMFLGGVGIWGALNAGSRYLQFEKDLGAIHSRFYAITKDEKQASEEFNYIRKLATDTALDIKSTADSYSIFYSATQKALGTEGARGVFENWTKVGRVLHLSEYQMERVTYALREMASKGAIYSQDLRMQIGTHVPNAMGLAQEAAEQMGITGTDWFEKLQQQAKGNTKVTTEFVRRFSANAEKMFGSPEALQKALQQPDALAKMISNIGYNFMVDFSKAGGSYMIVKILTGISKALTSIDYNKLANNLGDIARVVGNIFSYMPQIFEVLKLILQSVAIFYGLKAFGAVFGLMRNVFYMFKQGKFLSTMVLKLFGGALSGTMRKALLTALLKKGAWAGLRVALSGILGATGPLGWLVTALMWVPELIALVKWIANKLGMGGKGGSASEQLQRFTGLDATSINAIKNGIDLSKIHSQKDLENALRMSSDPNAYNLIPYAKYDDKSTFNLVINNTELSAKDIADISMNRYNQENEKKKSRFDQYANPKITFNKGDIRGR